MFLLRATQIGLHMADLECLEWGEVLDLLVESGNDREDYPIVATQEDFDRF